MTRRLISFVLCILSTLPLFGRIIPSEGSRLNYRIIGFSFPAKKNASQYIIEIANGHFNNEKEFSRQEHQTISSDTNKIITEVARWGKEYTWKVTYKSNNFIVAESDLYHFSTGTLPKNNATRRLRLSNTEAKYTDAYVLFDEGNKMYDLNGVPVWYLPNDTLYNKVNDIKASPSGTITFLANGNAFDISYDGRILWKLKDKATENNNIISKFNCHHEFNKLRNGHYMSLMGDECDQTHVAKKGNNEKKFFPHMCYSMLTEFDKDRNKVWSWRSSDYIQQSDLHTLQDQNPKIPINLHENAFCFDEKDSVIFLSMAGINRIVKIQYPSGNVLMEDGKKAAANIYDTSLQNNEITRRKPDNKLFPSQHSLSYSDDHYLYTYKNNRSLGAEGGNINGACNYPQILKLKESGDTLENVWNYDCKPIIKDRKISNGGGGNIVILPDHSLFVSMNIPYGDVFIADTNKKILWSAVIENFANNTWEPVSRYRASIITRAQPEQLIWNEP